MYSIIIEPCEEGGFLTTCPLLQGCFAEGDTYIDTIKNIEGVIRVFIEIMQVHGNPLPVVPIETIQHDARFYLPLLVPLS